MRYAYFDGMTHQGLSEDDRAYFDLEHERAEQWAAKELAWSRAEHRGDGNPYLTARHARRMVRHHVAALILFDCTTEWLARGGAIREEYYAHARDRRPSWRVWSCTRPGPLAGMPTPAQLAALLVRRRRLGFRFTRVPGSATEAPNYGARPVPLGPSKRPVARAR